MKIENNCRGVKNAEIKFVTSHSLSLVHISVNNFFANTCSLISQANISKINISAA